MASNFDQARNDYEAGIGLGLVVYYIPDIITGGQQITVDESQTEISPTAIIEAAPSILANPQWLLVLIATASLLFLIYGKRGS